MRIAVDTRFLKDEDLRGSGNFSKEVFWRVAENYKEHQFFFLFNGSGNSLPELPPNVSPVVIATRKTNLLLERWLFDVKIPSVLQRYKVDVFVCPNGVCSLTTSIPQVFIVRGFTSLFKPAFFKKALLSRFMKKAKAIAVPSEHAKKEIENTYKIPAEKIGVIGSGTSDLYSPLDWEEREQMKELYAQGCEYFVFKPSDDRGKSLMDVLKAFSNFKKWQKTNMKLVITGNKFHRDKGELEKLNTYKYRNEVNVIEQISEDKLAKVVAGAYAMVCNSFSDRFPATVLEAMQSEVPVITIRNGSIPEIAGEAALYAGSNTPEGFAEQMKLVFKDENLRNKLIEDGKLRAGAFSWDKTSDLVWKMMEQAVSK